MVSQYFLEIVRSIFIVGATKSLTREEPFLVLLFLQPIPACREVQAQACNAPTNRVKKIVTTDRRINILTLQGKYYDDAFSTKRKLCRV